MRSIKVSKYNEKYMTFFLEADRIVWTVESYVIETHEVMVAWIENGIHPNWNYR